MKFNLYPLVPDFASGDTLLIWQASSQKVKQVARSSIKLVTKVPTIATLKALDVDLFADGDIVEVVGYSSSLDGGGGMFILNKSSTTATNLGTSFQPDSGGNVRWFRLYSGLANVKWFGATGLGIADDTASIQNAIDTFPNSDIYAPQGKYNVSTLTVTSNIQLFGAGSFYDYGTVFRSIGAAGSYAIHVNLPIGSGVYFHDFCLLGNQYDPTPSTSGGGIKITSEASNVFDRIYFNNLNGYAVYLNESAHVDSQTFKNLRAEYCKGGIYGRSIATAQVNAIAIHDCELSKSRENGVDIWGTNIVVKSSRLQGNAGYGILISPAGSTTNNGSAGAYEITGNYLEANKNGNIGVVVGLYGGGAVSKFIDGLVIENNFSLSATAAMNPGQTNDMVFSQSGTGVGPYNPYVRGLSFRKNDQKVDGSLLKADFGNTLGADSIVNPNAGLNMGDNDADPIAANWTNFGLAKVIGALQVTTLQGFALASGDFTYQPGAISSDSVAISGTPLYAYFPVTVDRMAEIIKASVYADTDSANFTIEFAFQYRDPRGNAAYANLQYADSITVVTGGGLVQGNPMSNFTADSDTRRLKKGKEDCILRIKVTGTANTYFKLGNPFIQTSH